LLGVLQQFPPGSLQFEVGVQTFDPDIQQRISRRQDNAKTQANLHWLRQHTGAHIHADLIFGLPGDTLDNFATSFDALVALQPQEIQLGILKKLRGAPLNRHTETFDMRYNPAPPYNILATRDINFITMQDMNRFARYWDLIGNSGHFRHSLPVILGDAPFQRFLQLVQRLYETAGATWKISLERLFRLVYTAACDTLPIDHDRLAEALTLDHKASPLKGKPRFQQPDPIAKHPSLTANQRQQKHL